MPIDNDAATIRPRLGHGVWSGRSLVGRLRRGRIRSRDRVAGVTHVTHAATLSRFRLTPCDTENNAVRVRVPGVFLGPMPRRVAMEGRVLRYGVIALAAALASTLLTGCSFGGNAADTPDDAHPSPSPSPSAQATPTPTATPSGIDDTPGPSPDRSPVTPDVFMMTVDAEMGVLRVVVLVPDIYEEGGLCTVTVEGQSGTMTKEGTSVADASATMCGEYTFGLDDLGSGTARISATYESGNYEGSSTVTEVSIP